MTNELHPDLIRLGDELERAVAGRIALSAKRSRPRSRVGIISVIVAGFVAIGGGAAVAIANLSAETVARGMPGAAAIFEGTDPVCSTSDQVVFDCVLTRAPKPDPATPDFAGAKLPFLDAQGGVAGGCSGVDSAGLRWRCYAGERAVTEGIIERDLLGQRPAAPAQG